MKIDAETLLRALPGPRSAQWPEGARFVEGLRHGSMSVELYAPRGHDPQQPHEQDELYLIISGTGVFRVGDVSHHFKPHTCLFVPAGMPHRFEEFTPDFATWVVFWGPRGGESDAVAPERGDGK